MVAEVVNFGSKTLEMVGSLFAAKLWSSHWRYNSITFYNDNPEAAGAIINKHCKLGNHPMKSLCRDFCKEAVDGQYMFWHWKVDAHNEIADALPRVRSFKDKDTYTYVEQDTVVTIVNNILAQLQKVPPVHTDI